MSLETILKPVYRLFVRTGLVRIFVNPITRRISLTTTYYLYKSGLIPNNPLEKRVVTKTKIKKVPVIPGFIPLPAIDQIVPPGNQIKEKNAYTMPVVAFIDIDTESRSLHLRKLAMLQLTTFGFRPLIITNSPDFSTVRKYGYMFEYLPNRNLWRDIKGNESYDDFIQDRKNEIIATHRPLRVLSLSDTDGYLKHYTNPATANTHPL